MQEPGQPRGLRLHTLLVVAFCLACVDVRETYGQEPQEAMPIPPGQIIDMTDMLVTQNGGRPDAELPELNDMLLNSYLLAINRQLDGLSQDWNERLYITFPRKLWYSIPPWDITFEKVFMGPVQRDGPAWQNEDGMAYATLTTAAPVFTIYSRGGSNYGTRGQRGNFQLMVMGLKLLMQYPLGGETGSAPLTCKRHGPATLQVLKITKYQYSFDDMPLFPPELQATMDPSTFSTVTIQVEDEREAVKEIINSFFARSQVREVFAGQLVCKGDNDRPLNQPWPPPEETSPSSVRQKVNKPKRKPKLYTTLRDSYGYLRDYMYQY